MSRPSVTIGLSIEVHGINPEDIESYEGVSRIIQHMKDLAQIKGKTLSFNRPLPPFEPRNRGHLPPTQRFFKLQDTMDALEKAAWDVGNAARLLRVPYDTLYNRLLNYQRRGLVGRNGRTWYRINQQ